MTNDFKKNPKKNKGKTTRPHTSQPYSQNQSNLNLNKFKFNKTLIKSNKFISEIQSKPAHTFYLSKEPLKNISENPSDKNEHEPSSVSKYENTVVMFSNLDDEIQNEFDVYAKKRVETNQDDEVIIFIFIFYIFIEIFFIFFVVLWENCFIVNSSQFSL